MTATRVRRVGVAAVAAGVAVALAGFGASAVATESAAGRAARAAAPVPAPAAMQAQAITPQICTKGEGAGFDGLPAVASLAPNGTVESLQDKARSQLITKSHDRLIVGTSGDVLLWGARNPETGRLDGFDIQLANELGKALKTSVEFRVINYGQRLPYLKERKVDVVLHTMTINCKRWFTDPNAIDFSTEYYHAGQKILVDTDFAKGKDPLSIGLDDMKGKRLCVANGSTNKENVEKFNTDNPSLASTPVTVDDLGECLVKFQEGTVDAITGDDTVMAGFAKQDPYYAVVVGQPLTAEPYGIGVNKENKDLLRFVNALLDQLRTNGRLKQIYAATMGTAVKGVTYTPPAPVYGRS